jgi:hypothetical protein
MILDATAGNRTMWKHKNTENIIYIDIEKKLSCKPTIFADNTNTPFLSEIFDTIFYDPPHVIRGGEDLFFSHPDISKRVLTTMGLKGVVFYGVGRYTTKQAFITHVYRAQKEFYRILKNGGLLWLKWNEVDISLNRILSIFADWHELLRIYVRSPLQTIGKAQTYWVCLTKEKREDSQTALS